jgi:hypothetical protein
MINEFSVSFAQEFKTSRIRSYLLSGRSKPSWEKDSRRIDFFGSMDSEKQFVAEYIMSLARVVGVTGNMMEDELHFTRTFLSPALTAETGASIPGKSVPPPSSAFLVGDVSSSL